MTERNRVTLRLPAEQMDVLHAIAYETGYSVNDVARSAIARYLDSVPLVAVALSDWIAVGKPRDRRLRRKEIPPF